MKRTFCSNCTPEQIKENLGASEEIDGLSEEELAALAVCDVCKEQFKDQQERIV